MPGYTTVWHSQNRSHILNRPEIGSAELVISCAGASFVLAEYKKESLDGWNSTVYQKLALSR